MIIKIIKTDTSGWVYELDGCNPPQNIASSRKHAIFNALENIIDKNTREVLIKLANNLPTKEEEIA